MNKSLLIVVAVAAGLIAFFSLRQDPALGVWDDYAQRIARMVEQEPVAVDIALPRVVSDISQRRIELPESRVSLGKALSLGECGLVPSLARNNNSLGKVASDSQQLVLTQTILGLAADCQPDSPDQQATLKQLIDHRQQLWPALLANTVFAGPEFAQFFKANAPLLRPAELISAAAPMESLVGYLESAQSGTMLTTTELERRLQALTDHPSGGSVVQSTRVASQYLAALTQQLESHRICQGPKTAQQSKLVREIFQKVYLEDIQPDLAALTRVASAIDDRLKGWGSRAPRAIDWFVDDWNADTLRQATKAHALAWKSLLSSCGLSVGTTQ